MFDQQVLAFTLVAAVLTMTPGADTMLVVRNVLQGGRGDGVATTFGICSGLFVHAALSALGISAILMHSAAAFQIVKTAGAAYLVWLGWQSLRRARGQGPDRTPTAGVAMGSRPAGRRYLEGLFTNLLNPKVAIFYLAFLPQFIDRGDPVLAKSFLLAAIHCLQGIFWLLGVSVFMDRARRLVSTDTFRRRLDAACGVILVALGVRLLAERP